MFVDGAAIATTKGVGGKGGGAQVRLYTEKKETITCRKSLGEKRIKR
jgi:hypothetical protein